MQHPIRTIIAALLSLSVLLPLANAQKPEAIEKIKSALPDKPQATPKKKHKILVFSKTNGFRHGSIPTGTKCMELLGGVGNWETTITEDDSFFEPDTLKKFDAVIFVNTTGEVFLPKDKKLRGTPEAKEREARLKKSLVDFVENGGGLAGTHSATDTYKNWKDYNDMMGGAFAGHPWHKKVPIKNLLPENPVNWAFSKGNFEVADEIYQFRKGTASPDDRKMLLALDNAKLNDVKRGNQGADGLYPISWIDTRGKGRIFYCSLGHRDEIYWNPVVLKHYLAGIQYVLGDLDAP